MRTQRLELDGLTIRYTWTQGQEGRTPLLLLNGVGASLETAESLLVALSAQGLSTLSLDLPGIGGSSFGMLYGRMSGYADLVKQVMDALDIPEAHVMGYSWGGALAQHIAYHHGAYVRCLILACTSQGFLMVPGWAGAYLVFFQSAALPRGWTGENGRPQAQHRGRRPGHGDRAPPPEGHGAANGGRHGLDKRPLAAKTFSAHVGNRW